MALKHAFGVWHGIGESLAQHPAGQGKTLKAWDAPKKVPVPARLPTRMSGSQTAYQEPKNRGLSEQTIDF